MIAVLISKVRDYAGESMLAVALYASTIFLSAFLLFQVQPIIGKMILPWYGGSAAVWNTCLLFFQALLLLGYLYAHWLTRSFTPWMQAWIHICLLAVSIFFLPITPDAAWKPSGGEDPTLLIIGLMAMTIGLPYFLLSSTGPLVQAWFAREKAGAVPYRLFALSNFGSMLGLLSFPVLFEPWLSVPLLSTGWSTGYISFALICGMLAWRGAHAKAAAAFPRTEVHKRPHRSMLALWIVLAACPTVLLMAVTSHLTHNVAPTPLLWVLPLGLYLLSFILCFEGGAWYRRAWYLPLFLIGLSAVNLDLVMHWSSTQIVGAIMLYCGVLFICCMVCHGELEKLKPHADHLTSFYLMIAAGGALGGTFVALAAPRLFNGNYELPLASLASITVLFMVMHRELADPHFGLRNRQAWLRIGMLAVAIVSLIVVVGMVRFIGKQKVMARNFYGTLRIVDTGKGEDLQRKMVHGSITHGAQYLDANRRKAPTTYYGENGGAGLAILGTRNSSPQRVGVVGLGTGTLAAYGRTADQYRFYEINPLVIDLAKTQFTFLAESAATAEIVLGDARLSMELEPAQNFDTLIIDAFSGDSVPVHLLTLEAFKTYFKHLRPQGILAVHVSNNNLDLVPVVRAAADVFNMDARLVETAIDNRKGLSNSKWVLISSRSGVFDQPGLRGKASKISVNGLEQPWADDYSSIYTIMK